MVDSITLGESLRRRGITPWVHEILRGDRLDDGAAPAWSQRSPRPGEGEAAVRDWLSFQECTGCTESLTRSHAPTVEGLIFDFISLDYHHTCRSPRRPGGGGREAAMHENAGKYIVVVDGSIRPRLQPGYSTIAGISNYDMLMETVKGAAAVVAVALRGLRRSAEGRSEPTGAVAIQSVVRTSRSSTCRVPPIRRSSRVCSRTS